MRTIKDTIIYMCLAVLRNFLHFLHKQFILGIFIFSSCTTVQQIMVNLQSLIASEKILRLMIAVLLFLLKINIIQFCILVPT